MAATGEYSTAGTTFKIGSETISGMISTPDFGTTPAKIKVTTFDDTEYERYIAGLMDVTDLNFDFYDNGTNFQAAKSAEETAKAGNTEYVVTFAGGTVTLTGSHKAFYLGAGVGEAMKFRIAVTAKTIAVS